LEFKTAGLCCWVALVIDMDERLKQQIASRFAVIANLGQSHMSVSADRINIVPTQSRSRTRAEVSSIGSQLRVNPSFFPSAEVERRIITYAHEAAHLGQSRDVHHKPKFWEKNASILAELYTCEKSQRLVESFFTESIDWDKVLYRAVQDVADPSVDGRIETVDERKLQLADDIGYGRETARRFELTRYSWQSGNPDVMFYEDDYSESVPIDETPANASEYTEEDFIAFIDKYGEEYDETHISFESPLTYLNGSHREFVDYEFAQLASAFADRVGMDYCPMTDASAVVDGVYAGEVTDEVQRICERYVG